MKRFLIVATLAFLALSGSGLAADKGSQLIFQSNTAHQNFISVQNTATDMAVTVLTQYYNNEMELALWYLRIIPAQGSVLIDPFNHTIPGTDKNSGEAILESGKSGSGHFVIAVTAVAAETVDNEATAGTNEANTAVTANILFPGFLVKDDDAGIDLHGMDNIDNCGQIKTAVATAPDNNLEYTPHDPDGINDCRKENLDTTEVELDDTSKNVGGLTVDNAVPVAFNYLSGHFTEALMTEGEGMDQTASWGGSPVTRPAVDNFANAMTEVTVYEVLDGTDATGGGGGRLAEKSAGGTAATIGNPVSGYTNEGGNAVAAGVSDPPNGGGKIDNTATGDTRDQRALNDGYLAIPSLHGGGDRSHQIALLLSAADDFGDKPGQYKLIPALTKYKVALMDNEGDLLPDPKADSGPIYGGGDAPETPPGVSIIVEGIQVMVDAGKCDGTMLEGPWMLANLVELVPAAMSGSKKFAGLGAMLGDSNSSPGSIKFMRTGLDCSDDFGDGDPAGDTLAADADGVPTTDKRTFKAGTLVMDETEETRSFVTTGRVLLKYISPGATFAASWPMKSN